MQLSAGSEDQQQIRTTAATVSDLLRERGIAVGSDDLVEPPVETAITEGMTITYRAAFPVTFTVAGISSVVTSSARDVSTFLAQRGITLGADDQVVPALDQPIEPDSAAIRIIHVSQWTEFVRDRVAPVVEHRLSFALSPNGSKVVSKGTPGLRERLVSFRRVDDELSVEQKTLMQRTISKSKPKIVLNGVIEYEKYAKISERGLQGTMRLANAAFHMIATAYTAGCAGCSGYTALGIRAGHGIVAVDPSVIPLGTRLYIPGYGRAIAGDTGGAIRGQRIDLGFDSNSDALSFGRRLVHVYVLK